MTGSVPHGRRWVDLTGAHNVRDLGGLPTAEGRWVRTGRVFRSDSLDRCEEADVAQLRARGIAHLVDLRDRDRGRLPLGADIVRTFLPLAQDLRSPSEVVNDPAGHGLRSLYLEYLTTARQQTGRVISVIAQSCDRPLVFHCTSGKDRTGVVAAMLLLLLGVPAELVVEDYALTDARMPAIVAGLRGTNYGVELVDPEMLRARPETMRSVLESVLGREGSAERWALGSGVDPADIAQLRARLVVNRST